MLALCAGSAAAQTADLFASTNGSPSATSGLAATNEMMSRWSFSAAATYYLIPDGQDFVQPTFSADHDWLHLEARYNYENRETASAWLGYNLGGGEKVAWELTPMLGGVFGDVTGIAPGYEGSLEWWKLKLYSEGEFVINTRDSASSYFYNWSELSIEPVNWLRLGLVTQRTRVYHTDRDIQRGFLAGVSFKKLDFTFYMFNPDESSPTYLFAVGFTF
jgi:hypothetical protein